MSSRYGLSAFLVCACLATVAAKAPRPPASFPSSCGSSSTAWAFLASVQGMFSDTLMLPRTGLSVHPGSSIALLTNTAVCDSVIAAHNAHVRPDTAFFVTSPLIVKAGTSYFVWVKSDSISSTFVYDSTYTFKSDWLHM